MASPNISFEQIPSSIRKPGKYFEFNAKLAVRTLPANTQRVLILGQRLAAGSVPALTPTQVFSDAEAASCFGQGSILHRMVRSAIKAYPYVDITCLPLDDAGAGVAATGTTAFTGTATGSGVATLQVGKDLVQVAVSSGDTAAVVAAALKAQADQQPDLPVSASAAAGTLTLTAKHKGTLGNQIKLLCSCTAPGITSVVTAMASGATDPTLATALALIAGAGHTIIISPYADQTSLLALRDHLTFVGGPLEMRGAVAVYAQVGSVATATTLAASINHERIVGALLRGAYCLPWEIAAALGAVVASEEDPAMPLNTLPLTGVDAPAVDQRLTRTEQEVLLHNGVTPLEVGADGTTVRIVRAVTTYLVNASGVQDVSWLDITKIRIMDFTRKSVRERVELRFPRAKLSARTPAKVRSEMLDVAFKLEELEILENVEANKDYLICERDSQDSERLNARFPADVVNGLHILATRIDMFL